MAKRRIELYESDDERITTLDYVWLAILAFSVIVMILCLIWMLSW